MSSYYFIEYIYAALNTMHLKKIYNQHELYYASLQCHVAEMDFPKFWEMCFPSLIEQGKRWQYTI